MATKPPNGMCTVEPIEESKRKTGKGPVSVRWVDTDKAEGEMTCLKDYDVRCRLVGRDFRGGERGSDDLFAELRP